MRKGGRKESPGQVTGESGRRVELHQFDRFWGLPNASPFCMKAEGYLRWRSIPFDIVVSGPRNSPSGQVPWVVDGSTVITDSQRIIEHFEAGREDALDGWLGPREEAVAHMLRRVFEFELFWQINYSRWVDPQGWARFGPDVRKRLPLPMRLFGLRMVRRRLAGNCRMLGLRADNRQAAYDRGKAHIRAVSNWLGDSPYMLGERISSVDFSGLGALGNIMRQPARTPLKEYANSLPNLASWLERMWEQTFAADF